MNEIFQPLYDSVEKVLKGESIGAVNTGIPDAFVEVSKEFIGYNCFGDTIRGALIYRLAGKIANLREQGLIKSDEMFVPNGDVDNDIHVAYELADILFPAVFETSYNKREDVITVIDAMYAFLPCTDIDVENVLDILGQTYKDKYEESSFMPPRTTEDLYNIIIYKVA